jgi:hypothetical protein
MNEIQRWGFGSGKPTPAKEGLFILYTEHLAAMKEKEKP